jgi:hypothetical protein
MGFASNVLRRASKRMWVRWMDRAGGLVGRWVDTSADAPASRFAPKRNLYQTLEPANHHLHDLDPEES